jgi:hypothetical protein
LECGIPAPALLPSLGRFKLNPVRMNLADRFRSTARFT